MNNPVFDYQCFCLDAHNYLRNSWVPESPVQVNSTKFGAEYVVNYTYNIVKIYIYKLLDKLAECTYRAGR